MSELDRLNAAKEAAREAAQACQDMIARQNRLDWGTHSRNGVEARARRNAEVAPLFHLPNRGARPGLGALR